MSFGSARQERPLSVHPVSPTGGPGDRGRADRARRGIEWAEDDLLVNGDEEQAVDASVGRVTVVASNAGARERESMCSVDVNGVGSGSVDFTNTFSDEDVAVRCARQ